MNTVTLARTDAQKLRRTRRALRAGGAGSGAAACSAGRRCSTAGRPPRPPPRRRAVSAQPRFWPEAPREPNLPSAPNIGPSFSAAPRTQAHYLVSTSRRNTVYTLPDALDVCPVAVHSHRVGRREREELPALRAWDVVRDGKDTCTGTVLREQPQRLPRGAGGDERGHSHRRYVMCDLRLRAL